MSAGNLKEISKYLKIFEGILSKNQAKKDFQHFQSGSTEFNISYEMADNLKDRTIIANNIITSICTVITAIFAAIALFYVSIWKKGKEQEEASRQQQLQDDNMLRREQLQEDNRLRREQLQEDNRLRREQLQQEDRLRREQLQEDNRLRREQLQEEKRLHEKKLEDAKRQAARDADKFAGVISQKYDEVVNIFCNFQKNVEKLMETFLVGELSEFHVLSFMCHPDNNERFTNLEGVLEDVEKIMKLFFEFRIQLSPIHDKECPKHIKDEFSEEIIEMGQTIFPFVSTARQKVIKVVLKYFGCADFPRQDPNSLAPEEQLRAVNSILSRTQTEWHQTQVLHDKIQRAIPYLSYLRYENGVMYLKPHTVTSIDSCIESLEVRLVKGGIQQQVKQEIFNNAKNLWPPSSQSHLRVENLLYLIRMVRFKLVLDPKFSKEEALCDFLKYVRSVVNAKIDVNKAIADAVCERTLQDIQFHLNNLKGGHRHLLEDPNNLGIITKLEEELGKSIKKMIQDSKNVQR